MLFGITSDNVFNVIGITNVRRVEWCWVGECELAGDTTPHYDTT